MSQGEADIQSHRAAEERSQKVAKSVGNLSGSQGEAVIARRGLRPFCASQCRENFGVPEHCRSSVMLPLTAGQQLTQPSRGDQDGLEVHDERAALIVDGRTDGFEQAVSDRWFEGGVVAP